MMRKRRKNKNIWKIIVVIFLVFITVVFVNNSKISKKIVLGVKNTGFLIMNILDQPTRIIENIIIENDEKEEMYKKYSKLKQELSDKKNIDIELEELKNKYSLMEQTLKLNKESEYKLINARVINRKVGNWTSLMTIDKGSKDQVKIGLPVITSDGLIGQISEVTQNFAQIKLITQKDNSNISIKIKNMEDYIYGTIIDYNNGSFIIELFENKAVEIGSIVTTTGLTDKYPSGIIIGVVEKEELDSFGLTRKVFVKSKVDFNKISLVSVIGDSK